MGPQNLGLPVSFEGPYALGHELRFVPCYHWDGTYEIISDEDKAKYTFHAGDMYILSVSSPLERIIILSPITGRIDRVVSIPNVGLEVNIESDYFLNGRRVYIDIVHMTELFPGDDNYPKVLQGSEVTQGQPIGIQEWFFQWGRLEQTIDIAVRNGPRGANRSIPGNFYSDSYIDPFPFVGDDLKDNKAYIIEDPLAFRDHCKESIHLPLDF